MRVLPSTALAEQAVGEERLGTRGVTDLLCISYSSTDYIGHAYGPQSHEVLEMTVAIDRTLGQLFAFVDSTVGLDNCLIALSSDHGVSPIPEYVKSHSPGADAGRVQTEAIRASCEAAMSATFGDAPQHDSWIASITDHNIYINRKLLWRRMRTSHEQQRSLSRDCEQSPGSLTHGTWHLPPPLG